MALMRLSSEGRWDNGLFEQHPGWETPPSLTRSQMPSLNLSPPSAGLLAPALLRCSISRYPQLCNLLPLTVINSNNTPFPASQPISPPSHLTPSLSASLYLPLYPFIEPNLFVMSSLGKLRPICCHSLNEFIGLCIGHGSISPSSRSLSCPPTPPLTSAPSGTLYIRGTTPGTYCSPK